MDNSTNRIQKSIIEGIQDKKGSGIVVVDMSGIDDCVCDRFVICEGATPNQTTAIAKSIGDKVSEECDTKPYAVAGLEAGLWIAIDYGDIFVHIFQKREREFYDLEHLWADAKLTAIPDID